MINAEHEGRKILHICCKSDSELPRNQKKKGGGKITKSQLLKGAFLNSCALKNHTLCIL